MSTLHFHSTCISQQQYGAFLAASTYVKTYFVLRRTAQLHLRNSNIQFLKKCTSSHILYFYNSLCFFRHTTESVVLINHRTRRGSNQFNDYLSCTIDSFALATTKYQISNNWVPKSVLKNWTKRLLPPHCFFILLNFNSKKIQLFSASDFKILWTPS